MPTIWIVMYQTNMGAVFGWVCRAANIAEAAEQFGKSTIVPPGSTVRCVAQLPMGIVDPYFALYEEVRDER